MNAQQESEGQLHVDKSLPFSSQLHDITELADAALGAKQRSITVFEQRKTLCYRTNHR